MQALRSRRITIRLSDDEYLTYLRAATGLGMDLSQYLRRRLASESDAHVAAQLDQLRLSLIDVNEPETLDGAQEAMLLEALLLLRRLAPPNDLRVVQGELQRQGYEPWYMGRPSSS